MSKHLTIRFAWHDNKWDGRICKSPEDNYYCVGTHSLLSERIARNRNIEIENENKHKKIDAIKNYIPPCFWCVNANSPDSYDIKHKLPFNIRTGIVNEISEELDTYSVFTWPFRLSFNHSERKKRIQGKYPAELEENITKFIGKFKKDESIAFFYLNYDNPISADEPVPKYVLLGCSLIRDKGEKHYYTSDPKDAFERLRTGNMKNFTPLNWAIQFNLDFENNGFILPYHDYLEHIEKNPEDEGLLRDFRALIDEENIVSCFKYVAMDIDDDKCLYLLYKLKKSLLIAKEHGLCNVTDNLNIVDHLLKKIWTERGLYPSLGNMINILLDSYADNDHGNDILTILKENIEDGEDLLDKVCQLWCDYLPIPEYLSEYSHLIQKLRINIKDFSDKKLDLLKKLSLFNLNINQYKKILYKRNTSGFKKSIDIDEIISNPYILCENYKVDEIDLDKFEINDEPIDFLTIDIGMFPDINFVTNGNIVLQNLSPKSPQRIRAIIIDRLYQLGSNGDCYSEIDELFDYIISQPIFYDKELNIDIDNLKRESSTYYEHFKERLVIKKKTDGVFYYLKEVKFAEELIANTITSLLSRKDYDIEIENLDEIIKTESDILNKKIPEFDSSLFQQERKELLTKIFRKSFYVITGKPGSGKTKVLEKIVYELHENGEEVNILAPTGKAALRINDQLQSLNVEAITIDKFILINDYYEYLDDFENIILRKKGKVNIENLIIDESSMVDLQKLSTLFSMLKLEGNDAIKRIIMVGDEFQLPPIGFGKPFVDIIEFLKENMDYLKNNYIKLLTNCRQEFDKKILKISDIYTEKNRYYEKELELINNGENVSEGFRVNLWSNKEELFKIIREEITNLFIKEKIPDTHHEYEKLNILFGLNSNGHVKHKADYEFRNQGIILDYFQIITPYRGNYFGTLGINEFVQSEYTSPDDYRKKSIFSHTDKIICINNWYRKNELILSNGSIGIIDTIDNYDRKYFFADKNKPLNWIDEENFELAYAITIHKSQGSDFKHTYLIIPDKTTLLSKELIYTALTRSKNSITLFLQKTSERNLLEYAKDNTFVLFRNTSIFTDPENKKTKYCPDDENPEICVRSKVEYIIYRSLMNERRNGTLDFVYENELKFKGKDFIIHPDFTIEIGDKTFYWEHLGMLDIKEYYNDWIERKNNYERDGYLDVLITSDDLDGVNESHIQRIIKDIKNGNVKKTSESIFSNHHYTLY